MSVCVSVFVSVCECVNDLLIAVVFQTLWAAGLEGVPLLGNAHTGQASQHTWCAGGGLDAVEGPSRSQWQCCGLLPEHVPFGVSLCPF